MCGQAKWVALASHSTFACLLYAGEHHRKAAGGLLLVCNSMESNHSILNVWSRVTNPRVLPVDDQSVCFMLLRYGSQKKKTYRSQRVSVSNILHFTNILITKLWMSIFMLTSEVLILSCLTQRIFLLHRVFSFTFSTTPCCSIRFSTIHPSDGMDETQWRIYTRPARWWWGKERSKLKDKRKSWDDAAIGADRSHLKYNHQTAVHSSCVPQSAKEERRKKLKIKEKK